MRCLLVINKSQRFCKHWRNTSFRGIGEISRGKIRDLGIWGIKKAGNKISRLYSNR
jgi:hypothetical protein